MARDGKTIHAMDVELEHSHHAALQMEEMIERAASRAIEKYAASHGCQFKDFEGDNLRYAASKLDPKTVDALSALACWTREGVSWFGRLVFVALALLVCVVIFGGIALGKLKVN